MKWFGESWGAPVCINTSRVPVPVGEPCIFCPKKIERNEQGFVLPFMDYPPNPEKQTVAVHLDCFLRDVGVKQ